MPVRAVDDKPSDTLVVVFDKGFWTGSSTLPHLHQFVHDRLMDTKQMIVRIWRGIAAADRSDAYLDYFRETGLREYRATAGNRAIVCCAVRLTAASNGPSSRPGFVGRHPRVRRTRAGARGLLPQRHRVLR